MTRDELLETLTTLDFVCADLALYCDTHCDDAEAAKAHGEVAQAAKKAREAFETRFGSLTQAGGCADGRWAWTENPWPWRQSGNFRLTTTQTDRRAIYVDL